MTAKLLSEVAAKPPSDSARAKARGQASNAARTGKRRARRKNPKGAKLVDDLTDVARKSKSKEARAQQAREAGKLGGRPVGAKNRSIWTRLRERLARRVNDKLASPEWFDGLLDDIQVYDGVLTAAEVKWLYDHPGQSLRPNLGTTVCTSNQNSTGNVAHVTASGSDDIAKNDVLFEVTDLPPNEWGYFLMGQNAATIPVSNGILCIGAPQIRFAKIGFELIKMTA